MKDIKRVISLSPVAVLLLIFLFSFFLSGNSGRMPVLIIFIITSVYAIIISKGRIDIFSRGASSERIMYMIWIFILAGAFAETAKQIGAVDATVNATLFFIPVKFLPVGIFLASCFISFSIGTSVGTIVALCPIATGLATEMGTPVEWYVAIVVGGSFFGDNLSFISDTTIASTQTQDCSMKDKFRANFLLVLPAAIITSLIYFFTSRGNLSVISVQDINWILLVPYLFVIVLAIAGMDVLSLLVISLFVTGGIGYFSGAFETVNFFESMSKGVYSMSELIIVTMLAGGILGIVKENGGLEYAIEKIKKHISSKARAEMAIAEITAIANLCTANNTIAILSVGSIVKKISLSYDISARRSASIMDTTSCFIQGIIPYGAQLLMASKMSDTLPADIIPYLYYPYLIGISVVISIAINRFKIFMK